MEKKTYIQEIIEDLTNRMDLITNQLRLIFDFVDKFKHKRHLIICSYLVGFYNSRKDLNFNQEILFKCIEKFNTSLIRKMELSNLIIDIALSLNHSNQSQIKKEEEVPKEENKKPKIPTNETILLQTTKNTYQLYNELFGETVLERPLSGPVDINKKDDKDIPKVNNINANNNQNLNNIPENINEEESMVSFGNKYNNKTIENEVPNINIMNNKNIIDYQNKRKTYSPKQLKKKKGPEDNPKKNDYAKLVKGLQLKNDQKIVKCFLCSENFNELDRNNYKLDCQCIIHNKCFNNYIINSIENNKIPILCPKCNKEVNNNIIYNSLNSIGNQDLIKKYENKCLELFMKKENNQNQTNEYYYCPTSGCNFCFLKKNNETKFTCPRCHKEYCLKCFKPWHNNTQCEQNNFQSIIKNNQLESLYQLGNNENYIECPKCHVYLQKINGFNSITCICGSEVCCKYGKIMAEKHNCT